jgi:exopolysaccharide production protein ExoQ
MVKAQARAGEGRLDKVVVFAMLCLTLLNAIQGKNGSDESSSFLNEVLWSLAYAIGALRLLAMNRELRALLSRSAPLLVFLVISLASTLWSVDPFVTLKNSIELVGTAIVAFYVVASLRLVEFLNVLAVFFAASGLASLALIFVSPGRARMFWGSGAWEGIYEEKNALGAAMALAIVVFLTLILRRGTKYKLLAVGGLILSVTLLVGSNSATALVDCVVVVAIGLVALACVSPSLGGVSRILAFLGAALAAAGAFAVGFDRDAVYAALGRTQGLSGRVDFWPYLNDAVNARPVLGYGYGAFFRSPVSKDYLSYYVIEAGGWTPYHAHDSFLQTCLDTGYVGLAALLVAILVCLFRAGAYFLRERDVVSLWPLLVTLFLVFGSYTETYLGNFNTLGTILFVTAFLYPIRANAAQPEALPTWQARRAAVSARTL